MAFIEKYVNHATNFDTPFFIKDDWQNLLDAYYYHSTQTINVFNNTYNVRCFGYASYSTTERIASIPMPSTSDTRPIFALKSKNENKFLYLGSSGNANGVCNWHFTSDLSVTGISAMGMTYYPDRVPYICIVKVGQYICACLSMASGGTQYYNNIFGIHEDDIKMVLGDIDTTKSDPEFGEPSSPNGYVPNADPSSDTITIPNTPSIGVSNVGFVNVYKPTQNSLQNLGSDLFPDFEELPEVEQDDDVLTMLAQGFEFLGKNITIMLKSYINSNLINYIIDCHCLPVTPTTGETENIKIGFKSFDQTAPRVTSDYVDFDCGSLSIGEYYGNFIDYVGTRASLYLPFVGFVPIKNEYFQNGTLSVKYRFNVIDGSFMCYVLSSSSKSQLKNSVVGTYSGNACVHIPITGVNYANMVSGVVTGGASLIGGIATGNVGLAVSGALNTIASKPQMQSSNSYNSTSSFLGIRYPYLLIEREVSNFSEVYPNEYGLPLNVTKTISELTGYIEMDDNIHIELNCMDDERTMIKELLTGGIII